MTKQSNSSDEMGLTYKANLPLSWKLLGKQEPEVIPDNSRFWQIMPLLDETSNSSKPVEKSGMNADLVRIESKLDLILEMLGHLYSQQNKIPKRVPVLISSQRIRWFNPESVDMGSYVELNIYMSDQYMIPLVLMAETVKTIPIDNMNGVWIEGKLLPMDETLHDWLEKYIFRQHRRQVAQHHSS